MKLKINLRLALIALIAIIATTIGITLIYYNLFQTQVRADLQMNARILMETKFLQEEYDSATAKHQNIDSETLGRLESGNPRITWIKDDGTVLYDNDADASHLANHLNRPEISEAFRSGSGESVRQSDTMRMNTYYYAVKLDNGTVLRVSTEAKSIYSVFGAVFPIILLIILLTLSMCIFIGHFLTKQLLRPINQMAEHLDDHINTEVYKELVPFSNKIRTQHENILAAAKSRQDFSANVSHELKTPLTAISGYAELLENNMVADDARERVAGQIRHNCARLLSLINDIIKLSELDHKELPREFTGFDLYDLASECCDNLRVTANAKNLSLTCSLKTASGDAELQSAMINGEKNLIKELIENLVQNAILYNRDNGYIEVSVNVKPEYTELAVKDSGIGIPLSQQERVFERFYRVDKSRSRETGGTGLGLAIVKHIAEIHDAEIILESTLGVGTSVMVRF